MQQHFSALAIVGPTASGKSGIAVEIAKMVGGAIVNGDPFQAYSGIPIGTGQPTDEERQGVPHFGYGSFPLDWPMNPDSFGAMARNWLEEARKVDGVPILVTGSGLYLRGIWNLLDSMPDVPEILAKKARRLCRQLGPPTLHRYLNCVDPMRASQLHPNDGSRIQRALALHFATGKPPSQFLSGVSKEIPEGWRVILVMPQRNLLRERIAKRVQVMANNGWREETMKIREKGQEEHIRRIKPIGYEIWLDEPDPKKAQQKIIRDTKAYAKRQTTWFNNQLSGAERLGLGIDDCGGVNDVNELLAKLSSLLLNGYSPSTSKSGQDESVDGCPMSRHTCREEGADAQDDGEQGENDRNAIAVRHIVNADGGCLAYPSASAGYREDCAYNGAYTIFCF